MPKCRNRRRQNPAADMSEAEAPVTADSAQKTHTDAQGGLRDTTVRKSENNKEDSKFTLGDLPQTAGCIYLETNSGDNLVNTTSNQTVNSNETRKRNFQPGNKEIHIFTADSSSHACEISVVDSKDARAKFSKKSDVSCLPNNCSTTGNTSVNLDYQKDDPVRQEVKNTNLAVISEELKENDNVYSFNSSNMKDEMKKQNKRTGKLNNDHNTNTLQDFALPAGTDTVGLMTMTTEDNMAGKCMGLRVKQNQNEVIMTTPFAVNNVKTAENGNVSVDSTIKNENRLVQPGSFEEKGTDNVVTLLGLRMPDSNLSSTNVSLMPLQGGKVNANFKTNRLLPTTQEKYCQVAAVEGFTKPSAAVPVSGMHESAYTSTFRHQPHTTTYHRCVPSFPVNGIYESGYTSTFRPQHHITGYNPHIPSAPVNGIYENGYTYTLGCQPHATGYHPQAPSAPVNGIYESNYTYKLGCQPHTTGYHHHEPSVPVNDIYESAYAYKLGYQPHTTGYHPHVPLTVRRPCGSEESQSLDSAKHMREAIFRPSFVRSVIENVLPYENQNNQLGPIDGGSNFFPIGNPASNNGENVHPRMNIHELDTMRNSDYGFRRSYWDPTSSNGNKLLEKERTSLSTDHNINCISPSSLAHAYNEKLRITFSPRQSLQWFRKKKLLILDLNGLLADINQDSKNAHMAHAKIRGKLVFRRPYCDDFLYFCIQNFELGIWSSRKRENVDSVVDILMRDFKPYLRFSWDRSKCTITGVKTLENRHKPLVMKELRKLWDKEEPGLPWEKGEFSPSNTLLVDDSPYKALRNPPYTAIFPYPYSYLNLNDNSLGPGGDLRVYLENLAIADNVEWFVRNYPFGQPFITQSDPNWNFYAQVAGEGYASLSFRA